MHPASKTQSAGSYLPSQEEKHMKKIEIRKTGPVRLTSAAHALYGGICRA